ncbi:MAG: DMT family transporter [Actinomycetia bacterium]|nr:DMT family transporter [Actinomycetes bacterium]
MFGVLLAALSALSYGASDFSGAVASKKADSTVVTVAAQVVSLLTLLAVLLVMPAPDRNLVDLGWGALGGIGVAVALVAFYRALAQGPMSTAAATTALLSAAVPVFFGLVVGNHPELLTLVGVMLAVPATVSVAVGGLNYHRRTIDFSPRDRATRRKGVASTRLLSVIAGLGFGLFFVALSRVSGDSGLFPLIGARGASIAALVGYLTLRRSWTPLPKPTRGSVLIAGIFDCGANSTYLLALDRGSFIWVAAIASMYPVTTVLLARLRLGEALSRIQMLGLAGTMISLVLITVGAEI